MAKNTHAQEVSTGTSDSYTEQEINDPAPPVRIQRAELGEVDKSAGPPFSQSLESGLSQDSNQNLQTPGLAPTMENPSNQSQISQEDSTVLLTDGGSQTTDLESTEELLPYNLMNKDDLKEECRHRGLAVSGTVPELVARLEEDDATEQFAEFE